MLWHVKNSKLYLLGSIHLLDARPLVLSPQAKRAYQRSRRIAFEQDLNAPPNSADLLLPPGSRLSDQIPAALFAAAHKAWHDAGISDVDLEVVRPWVAAMLIQTRPAERRGIKSDIGVDRQLWQRAEKDDKAIVTLEAPGTGTRILASTPLGEAIPFLSYFVENADVSRAELDSMISSWRARQQGRFEEILAHRYRLMPRTFERLITQRNRAWMPFLLRMIGDGVPTLAVVGVLHCVGAAGLPAMLAEAGMSVPRVDAPRQRTRLAGAR